MLILGTECTYASSAEVPGSFARGPLFSRPQCVAHTDAVLCGHQGSFYAPTVISGATTDMKIFREETVGPAIPLFKFGKDEEAVQLANNTEYGLAAYFWTKVSITLTMPAAAFLVPSLRCTKDFCRVFCCSFNI